MDDQPTEPATEAAPVKAASDTWRPSFGDIVTVVALVAAIIMWFAPPNWEVGIPVVGGSIALVILTALRHTSHPFIRGTAAAIVVALLIAVASKPIWTSFHKDYPNVSFRWPITFGQEPPTVAGNPPDMPPLNLPGAPLSTLGKVLYLCSFPLKVAGIDRETAKEQIRRNAEIFGNAAGITFVLSDITYGVRFDITPKDAEGALRMNGFSRLTIQLEAASTGIFVTLSANRIGTTALFSAMGVERDSDIEKTYRTLAAQIVGVAEGKCRLL